MYTQGGGWDPWGTAFDNTGRVWIATPSCDPSPQCGSTSPGQINVYNPQYNAWPVAYKFPANFGQPLFLAFDKQGRAWFPMPMSNSLGMFNPATNTFSQWAVPTASAGPWDIAVDAQGHIWFTEHYVNKIGYFNPATNKFTEIATPQANSQPYGITFPNGAIWYNESAVKPNTLVRFDPKTEKFQSWAIPAGGGVVRNMMTTRDGNIVIAESALNIVGLVMVGK